MYAYLSFLLVIACKSSYFSAIKQKKSGLFAKKLTFHRLKFIFSLYLCTAFRKSTMKIVKIRVMVN